MKGWLITNEFVLTDKFMELSRMLVRAAQNVNIHLMRKTNAEVWTMLGSCRYRLHDFFTVGCPFTTNKGVELTMSAADIDLDVPDFILFWDKDVRLAYELERQGLRVFNRAESIADCDDKAVTFLKLSQYGIPQPRTFIAPKKFHADGYYDAKFVENAVANLGFPCIMKECFGSFGQQVYLAQNMDELLQLIGYVGERPYILQEAVTSSWGQDIRVEVVGGRVIAAMLRSNAMDFRANITNGGIAEPCMPTEAQAQLAIAAAQALGLDFAGVDLMYGMNDVPIVCEVNSNAHFKNLYDCTGVNAADYIMAHIREQLK